MTPVPDKIKKLSIIIPTRDGGDRLLDVLDAVLNQECRYPFDIICVDSGSSMHQLYKLSELPVRIHNLRGVRFDHGLTRDFGFSISRENIVVLITQDARPVDRNWLAGLVEPLSENPVAAAAYSRQVPRPGASPATLERLGAWSASGTEPRVQRMPPESEFYSLGPAERLAIVAFDHVSCAVRRSVWNIFHHGPSTFGEDILWSFKALSAGYEIIYTPGSVIEHSHEPGIVELFTRTFRDHRNLREVLGAGFMNSIPEAVLASVHGVAASMLNKPENLRDEPPGRKGRKARRAVESFVSTWGQYLGNRFARRAAGGVSVHRRSRRPGPF